MLRTIKLTLILVVSVFILPLQVHSQHTTKTQQRSSPRTQKKQPTPRATQYTTNVTATITDSDTQTWNNGTWSASLYNPSSTQQPVYTATGQPVQTLIQGQTLNATGVLASPMPDNNQISPNGTRWVFTLCSNTSATCSTSNNMLVTGSSIDFSTQLSSQVTVPRFAPGSNARGYLDVEVTNPIAGSQYYNVTNNVLRQFSGTSWSNVTGNGNTGQVYNIKTYGATGNGTTDDAPSIRNATADAIANGGGTIYFPPGAYYMGSPYTGGGEYIRASGSHIHFVCDPAATITTQNTGVATIFRLAYPYTQGPIQTKTGFKANNLPNANASAITLSTNTDTSNFAVGDPIYILGGPGIEANGDGEINWITSIDTTNGILYLKTPTVKPYTGNQSNVGAAGIVTVMDGAGMFYYDDSVEGCTANNIVADFVFFGQLIGGRLINNTVTVNPSVGRGMMLNSYQPMANIEVYGNSYTAGSSTTIQLADGWRDIYIHNNTFYSNYGQMILNPSQGVANLHISYNNMYLTIPATFPNTNTGVIVFSTAYQVQVDHNFIQETDLATTGSALHNAVNLGLSNGGCNDCIFDSNTVSVYGGPGTPITQSAALVIPYGTTGKQKITNNLFLVNNFYRSVIISDSDVLIANNTFHAMTGPRPFDMLYLGAANINVMGNQFYADVPGITGINAAAAGNPVNIIGNYLHGMNTPITTTTGTVVLNNTCDTSHALCSNAFQTTVNCSTSGSVIYSMPIQTPSNRKVTAHLNACVGTASYTFPLGFNNVPGIFPSSTVASTLVSSLTTTAVTITGATSTGTIVLEDF